MKRVLTHVVFIAIALAITLIGLNFWGDFGRVMGNLGNQPSPAAKPANTGEVTVGIIPEAPSTNKLSCDKKHPCPR
jgi:hypothetical protein